jgi:hypothetical protein
MTSRKREKVSGIFNQFRHPGRRHEDKSHAGNPDLARGHGGVHIGEIHIQGDANTVTVNISGPGAAQELDQEDDLEDLLREVVPALKRLVKAADQLSDVSQFNCPFLAEPPDPPVVSQTGPPRPSAFADFISACFHAPVRALKSVFARFCAPPPVSQSFCPLTAS